MMNKYWVDGFAWGGRRCVSLDEHYEDRPVAKCVGAFGNEPSEFVAQLLQNTIFSLNDSALVPHLINWTDSVIECTVIIVPSANVGA